MSKDMFVIVKIPEYEIAGPPEDAMEMILGKQVRISVEGMVFDGDIQQVSVGRYPS